MKLTPEQLKRRAKRKAAERRFRSYGILALVIAAAMLFTLFFTIFTTGISAFWRYEAQVTFELTEKRMKIDPAATYSEEDYEKLARKASYNLIVKDRLYELFPDVKKRKHKKRLGKMLSYGAEVALRNAVLSGEAKVGDKVTLWVPLSDDLDTFLKGYIDPDLPEKKRRVKDDEISWLKKLQDDGVVRRAFDWGFFTRADSQIGRAHV